jgi:hypothetical protein
VTSLGSPRLGRNGDAAVSDRVVVAREDFNPDQLGEDAARCSSRQAKPPGKEHSVTETKGGRGHPMKSA